MLVHHLLAVWYVPVHQDAFWIGQRWKCVQQDAGRGHEGHIALVVQAHAAAGIKIQPCKTKLFQSEVEYLGHKISKGGVSMIPEYVQRIKNWPVPKSGKEMATSLGFTGYYCGYFKD